MQIMYRAVMRKPHRVKSLLLANVPGLKRLNVNVWSILSRCALQYHGCDVHGRKGGRGEYIAVHGLSLKTLMTSPVFSGYRPPCFYLRQLLQQSRELCYLLRREDISVDEDELTSTVLSRKISVVSALYQSVVVGIIERRYVW
ncbi:hypothetical protein PsorP6_011193 [Peronosclerospora sorghi]|uniref:Uncharacterized protein n=1 Tax=Peronosclerospora sorghi TaxID=230839 RepID=A0ACC0VW71_9STRA|nr:hypothetical protein PsorP6_011193 [Peronosclerospora sorghi]